MKPLIAILVLMLVALQYRLWVGEGSLADVSRLKSKIERQQLENDRLFQRNAILAEEVKALKSGLDAVEERAREDLGMVKEGETFYMIVDKEEQ